MKIETTMKTHWFWTAKIRKIGNIQCCHRHGAKRILNNYHWECKMVQMLYKTVQWFLTELNISSLFDPAIIAFDIYPNKLKICVHPKTSTRKFMEALVIISKTWKPLKLSFRKQMDIHLSLLPIFWLDCMQITILPVPSFAYIFSFSVGFLFLLFLISFVM